MTYKDMKDNNDNKVIETNHLIALCEIGEDYKLFCDDLEKLIKSRTNRDLVEEAYRVMHGDFSIHAGKYKSFIEKHQHTIEVLNKYHCLSNFTVLGYDIKGKRIKNLPEDYFYQYIEKHKENIERIKSIALKLKELGFERIEFNEKIDFTKREFELDKLYDSDFDFLDNIEIIPTYLQNTIRYRTTGSSYCMHLDSHRYGNREISENGKRIELNSLLFDPSKLPNEITTESTIGVIARLSDEKKEQYNDIKDSVDISISTDDLETQFDILKNIIERIDKTKNNEELANLLTQMKAILAELQSFGKNFEHQVVERHPDITTEMMDNEKKLYLKRRCLSSIDID